MDYTEPVYVEAAAVNKRKYLLKSLFYLDDFPKDTSTEDEDLKCEATKREVYESLQT